MSSPFMAGRQAATWQPPRASASRGPSQPRHAKKQWQLAWLPHAGWPLSTTITMRLLHSTSPQPQPHPRHDKTPFTHPAGLLQKLGSAGPEAPSSCASGRLRSTRRAQTSVRLCAQRGTLQLVVSVLVESQGGEGQEGRHNGAATYCLRRTHGL